MVKWLPTSKLPEYCMSKHDMGHEAKRGTPLFCLRSPISRARCSRSLSLRLGWGRTWAARPALPSDRPVLPVPALTFYIITRLLLWVAQPFMHNNGSL